MGASPVADAAVHCLTLLHRLTRQDSRPPAGRWTRVARPSKDAGTHFISGHMEATLFVLPDPLAAEVAATCVAVQVHHALATTTNGTYVFELPQAAGRQECWPGSSAPRGLPIKRLLVDLQQGTSGPALTLAAAVAVAVAAAVAAAAAATAGRS